jgi:hypothetical protein
MMRGLVVGVCSGLLLAVLACGDDDAREREPSLTLSPIPLEMHDTYFSGSVLVRAPRANDVLLIRNLGASNHTFTIDDLAIDEELSPGEEVEVVVPYDEEIYMFYCRFHPDEMNGSIGTLANPLRSAAPGSPGRLP